MGSWTEFDAIYPPGKLTPAAALLAALGRLAGARSVYTADGALADFLPRYGIAYDADLLGRVEGYLSDLPLDAFVAEASERLNRRQGLCLVLNLYDRLLAGGMNLPHEHPLVAALQDALGLDEGTLLSYRDMLRIKNDFSAFPQ